MKPDWDDLGDKFDKSKKVLIGEVDCTADGNKELCEAQGVTGCTPPARMAGLASCGAT